MNGTTGVPKSVRRNELEKESGTSFLVLLCFLVCFHSPQMNFDHCKLGKYDVREYKGLQ